MDFDVSGAATALVVWWQRSQPVGGAKILPNAAIKAWGWITSAIRSDPQGVREGFGPLFLIGESYGRLVSVMGWNARYILFDD
ncbi:hypothetical protein ABFU03_22480 [Xanthomonas campestris pv. campestris]|uniref:hypothetical protein n=1 Tax=Xanthomonas campestris TaxID=339 RepID=UPI0038902CFA